MKDAVCQWFEQSAPFQGLLACAVRHPDQASHTKAWSGTCSELALENVLRCVADLFDVVRMKQLPGERCRLAYRDALVHCERRADGLCLSVLTAPAPEHYDAAALERLFGEFRVLSEGTAL
jgi:hypothetical protein